MRDGEIDMGAVYGDLDEVAVRAAAGAQQTEERLDAAQKRIAELEKKVRKMEEEKRVWAKQRGVLVHNLGTLLKTARVEVERKDREIAKLREMCRS